MKYGYVSVEPRWLKLRLLRALLLRDAKALRKLAQESTVGHPNEAEVRAAADAMPSEWQWGELQGPPDVLHRGSR